MSSSPQAHPSPHVLFATPECAPLAKTGGLGDVGAALPAALRALGIDARVLLPGYPSVLAADPGATERARFAVLGHPVRLLESRLPGGVPLLVLDCPPLYVREGGPYQTPDGVDWEDNALRFGVLSKVAAMLGSDESPLDWRVDVVHCNDWQTALAPVYLRFGHARRRAATLVTIHNLAFQGVHTHAQVADIALPKAATGEDGMAFYGRLSFLRGGLVFADAINTVSPTYAREIQGDELGFGQQDVLRKRSGRLYGVLNGIDTATWNPETDPWIPSRYGADSLDRKAPNKAALRERLGLAGGERPLLGVVSRLTHQKGIDLILESAEAILAMGAQLAVVGTGERELVVALNAAMAKHPGQVGVFIGFDEALAHLVEAGSDVFLMPSRFEPCGMNQMYSQRYGTPPLCNATGGLIDTVSDPAWSPTSEPPTGYLMKSATAGELATAVQRAIADWKDRSRWRTLQRNGMARDFGWEPAARQYLEIYQKL